MARITCGLVIYDEIQEVQKLIPLLEKELQNFQVDWIFVLNHEQSEIRKWVQGWLIENVRGPLACFENPLNNLGFARQLILDHSKNELIYLTDPDIELIPGSVVKLLEYAQLPTLDLKIAGYGGAVKHLSDRPFLNETFELMALISKFLPFAFQIQNHSCEALVDHLPACHLLLRKSAALKIGGFCHRQSRCGEDIDFTHRAFNLGFRFVFLPSSQVLHWQNISVPLWYYKMFSFGQAQISVQKKNCHLGIRYYRLLPLIFMLAFIGLLLLSSKIVFFSLIAVFGLAFALSPAYLGFALIILSYSSGEMLELVWPTSESQSAHQLPELNANLTFQFFEASSDKLIDLET